MSWYGKACLPPWSETGEKEGAMQNGEKKKKDVPQRKRDRPEDITEECSSPELHHGPQSTTENEQQGRFGGGREGGGEEYRTSHVAS